MRLEPLSLLLPISLLSLWGGCNAIVVETLWWSHKLTLANFTVEDGDPSMGVLIGQNYWVGSHNVFTARVHIHADCTMIMT